MKTNRIVMTLAALLMAAAPAAVVAGQNQDAGDRTEQFQQRLQRMKERLQLTPEQQEQVRPIFVEEMQQLKAVRDKYGSGDQSRRTRMKMGREMRGIRNAADEKLRTILSKQQMDELKKMREEARQKYRNRASQE